MPASPLHQAWQLAPGNEWRLKTKVEQPIPVTCNKATLASAPVDFSVVAATTTSATATATAAAHLGDGLDVAATNADK